ncbi:MAG: IMP cyclohydrolase [Candidatus Hydrogenedentes bacterium]|nr:IMP cyclohydrolase [Candidatus Hydrogenedentota bacterium]
MSSDSLKDMYRSRNQGDFPATFDFMGRGYVKVEDLRYGTNPHQPAAFYRPANSPQLVLGAHKILKTGKSGLSQTNIEDMHHAVGILKYIQRPACAVMKHCNPSGVAMQVDDMPLAGVYQRARDADAQAAFGSVVVFNRKVDKETASAIMQTIVEGVAAPGFDDDALAVLNDFDTFRRNKEIRIIELPEFASLPKFVGDATDVLETKVFDDGSIVLAAPYLSRVRNADDLVNAHAEHKTVGKVAVTRAATPRELEDLLFAWYVNIHVRSNGCVIARNGQTLAVGTGEQDRVGAVEQAIAKAKAKYAGKESLAGAVLASDGFFPFRDAVNAAVDAGITAFVQPGGSVNDHDVIAACNEANVSMLFTLERCFSHH